MKKIIMASTAALLLNITPSYADTVDDIGNAIGDLTRDLQFGVGIGINNTKNLSNASLFYGIAEKDLDIYAGDILSSAQVRIGTGTNADIQGLAVGTTGSEGIDFLISGLYKARIELEDFNAYGLAGLTYTSSSASVTSGGITTNTSSTSTSITLGLGAEYELNPGLKVAAEYQKFDATSVLGVHAYLEF
ncbi:outer membrane beta-barrel protein [Ghiorsea bivora]|uniref:outer membrane beta-barrel protein n=1 Tax=Ghiorsea bivora TaxID=1485545 RepID=UPI000571694E|nr:outer membrane beta-barrel protein [Ghiorsea bivora]